MIRKAEEREMTGNGEERKMQGSPITWDRAID